MATLATNAVTLADIAKMMGPDGRIQTVIELLSQTNDVLMDMKWLEGNLATGHRTSVRTGLPTAAWRLINNGITPTKGTTAHIDEACGILEAWCEVDKDVAELNGDVAAYRLSEAKAHIEAMNQEFVGTLFYGNSSISPEEFTGLAIRYSSLSAANGQNIVNGGGVGSDNSSIWLICWGDQTVHGIYPKGSTAGLQHKDLGLQVVQTSTGIATGRMLAYQDQYQWKCGIALKDWRYAVRGANIDISALTSKTSAADLFDMMIKMTHRIPHMNMGTPVFYMNRTVFQELDIQRRDDVISGGQLTYADSAGKLVPSFRGIPIRVVDQLTEAEAAVS